MFGKKKTIENVPEDHPVHDDLIIHNMPNSAVMTGAVNGSSFSANVESASNSTSANQANFKTTGLLIIVAGFVFISLVVYFGYVYMIRPMSQPPVQNNPAALVVEKDETQDIDTESPTTDLDSVDDADDIELLANKPAEVEVLENVTPEELNVDTITEVALLPDSDKDGITDPEEEFFGTNPLLSDTDNDGYDDASEIKQGYNPLGAGKIDEQTIARLINDAFGYEISYPAIWPKQSFSEDSLVIFTAPDESLVQITATENTDKISILNWYQDSFPVTDISYDRLLSGQGWEGIASSDGLNIYLTDSSYARVIVLSFISNQERVTYPFIFQLMLDSLVLR